MIGKIILAGILATVGFLSLGGQYNAFACNKTAGCAMDVLLDGHDMMQDGRMDQAIKAGRENVAAFRALEAAQQKRAAQQGSTRK